MEAIFALSQQLGAGFKLVEYIFANRDDHLTDPYAVRLSPNDQFACRKAIRKLLGIPENDSPSNKPIPEFIKNEPEYAFNCSTGRNSFAVTSNGRLLACLLMNEPSVQLGDDFKADWSKLIELCDAVPTCVECDTCAFRSICKVCPAKLIGETGSFNQKAPYLCEMTELMASDY